MFRCPNTTPVWKKCHSSHSRCQVKPTLPLTATWCSPEAVEVWCHPFLQREACCQLSTKYNFLGNNWNSRANKPKRPWLSCSSQGSNWLQNRWELHAGDARVGSDETLEHNFSLCCSRLLQKQVRRSKTWKVQNLLLPMRIEIQARICEESLKRAATITAMS